MGCIFGHNYWYSQGAFRCKKCNHVTYKSHKRKKNNSVIIIPIIIAIAIAGFFVYQTYGTPQSIQNEASKIIKNTGNTIQQISSQSQQSISNLQTTVKSSINEDSRVPITVYEKCGTSLRTDLKIIDTNCYDMDPNGQHFQFNLPLALQEKLPSGYALLNWNNYNSKLYKYGSNDFVLGLYDQVGEKNYTVTLWQFPQ